ncbi:hypothetical protein SAMN05216199_3200 [Pedococcus cremeus]|uniref:ATP-grasp domain-containing protein n=2 Tax=Pedococcus cremeus TaxID=587636 RepID=A0A1H9WZ94_9MICO|nr:hypothetical protein SAMN05216199_3200 [Pedococcus cremeus]
MVGLLALTLVLYAVRTSCAQTAGMDDHGDRPPPTLGDMGEQERLAAFDRLQERLPEVWRSIAREDPAESVVVVPSMTLDLVVADSGALLQALEERFLFLLLLLRQPRLRMVYVTSMPIDPAIVEYYLSLLPGVIPSHARSRLQLVSVGDSSGVPLTDKLLERPRLVAQIAAMVPDPLRSHLIPYTSTERERDLALLLGIPMYAADPRHFVLGTKTGCRRLFTEAGVAHPAGAEDLHTIDEVVRSLADLRAAHPDVADAMVKLNEGVSGGGNALVDLRELPRGNGPDALDRVRDRVLAMAPEDQRVDVPTFLARLAVGGGVVEERLAGEEVRSPSVQLRITPLGELEVLSTHDQVLGGPSGQSYLGARFPADQAYAAAITESARRVGEVLVRKGVMGRFALDYVVVRHGSRWEAHAIEVNLRKGGTTHPFLTLQFLTGGTYVADLGCFLTPQGERRHLVATDHLEHPVLRGLRVSDLFDLIARTRLHFDQGTQQGVVFHMISCLTELGRVGMTAIGDTPTAAQALYDRAHQALLEEAREALTPRPVRF